MMNNTPAPPKSPDLTRGVITGVPLALTRRLCLPPTLDAFGRVRPPLDQTAMHLSLELAYMTYTLELEPWMRAGWNDISIQVDDQLQSGVTVGMSERATSERIRGLINGWKVARARMAMREMNPVAQVMGALRQKGKSDTIKAVTMLHPAAGGRFVVAIGFMGTGSRFYDWFSNFRFTAEEGFHKGFYQLTKVFEDSAQRIQFPDTARALGRESLTLADILGEMRAPDSRFTLWMAGHSQGAAIMQIFCHRLLTQWGVQPRHMVGYGFASPTAAVGGTALDAAAYPLYHILNSDDLVPRIGARMHLGIGLAYQADEALRSAAYGWRDTPEEMQLRADAQQLFHHIQDTPTLLESMAALLTLIREEKTEESFQALMEKPWSIAPLDKAFTFAEGRVKDTLTRMVRYARIAYHSMTGARMAAETVEAIMADMRPIVQAHSLRVLLTALRDRYHPPHMMRRAHGATGAYGYIAGEGHSRLMPFYWALDAQGQPVRCTLGRYAAFTPAPTEEIPAARHRKRMRAPVARGLRAQGMGRRRPRRRSPLPANTPPSRKRVYRLRQGGGFWHFPWRRRAAHE